MLQLIVPSLFQADALLDLLGAARLAGLDTLLFRGRHEPLASDSLEGLLCQELGIARQQDWPIAPIAMTQAGGEAGEGYWLRADPVHVRIERDRLILQEIPGADPDEERMLCAALSEHFAADFSLQFLRPGAWVLRTNGRPDITTTPLSQAASQHLEPLLPAGSEALAWRTLLNEAQMLLFQHPLNQAREARGEPVINSVWLWGGGSLPARRQHSSRAVLCAHEDWRALADFAGAASRGLPAKWSRDIADNALIILDEPHRRLRRGDLSGWLQAMQQVEANWLGPLLAAGIRFRADDPMHGQGICWRPAYRWKFWKRRRPVAAMAFDLQTNAPDATGIDAFGNRYQ